MRKLLLLLGLIVIFPCISKSQGYIYTGIALNQNGLPIPNPTITVCTAAGAGVPCTPTAGVSLFADVALTVPVSNPLPNCTIIFQAGCSDSVGNFSFYIAPGEYTYTISGSGTVLFGPFKISIPCTVNNGVDSCGGPGTFAYVPDSSPSYISHATPTFQMGGTQGNKSTVFDFVLNQNVGAITFSVSNTPPANTTIMAQLNLCENNTGGWTLPNGSWPVNVILPTGFSFITTAGACNHLMFRYNPLTNVWTTVVDPGAGGGGGATPAGNDGDVQVKAGGNLAAGHLNDNGSSTTSSAPIINNSTLTQNGDSYFKGPNPYVDVRTYGVRSMAGAAPATAGVTATTSNGSPNVTVSTSVCASQAGSVCFQNGDAVVIYGAGAANATSTPAAPTVTPSLNAAETGSLMDVAATAASTAYSYEIAAINTNGGITAASPAGTTTTGAASLGAQTKAFSTVSMANNLVSVATSTPHELVAGAAIIVSGVSQSAFNGWFIVNTVADNTHFTYLINSDTRNGTPTSGTGGSVTYHNVNHITWTAVSGAFKYAIWRTSPSPALIGISWPQNSAYAGDTTYLAFDDFGSPVTTLPNPPAYLTSSPPGAATNDMLISTILSGAGTTSLVLNNNAGAAVSGATILVDQALNAATAATAARASGAPLLFPPGLYIFNSPQTFPSGISVLQRGAISINETLSIGGVDWAGDVITPSFPSFAYAPHPNMFINAYPGIYVSYSNGSTAPFLHNLNIASNINNGGTLVIFDGAGQIPAGNISDINFTVQGSGNDYSNIGLLYRGGSHTNTVSDFSMTNILFLSNQNGNTTGTTPAFFANNMGNIKAKNIFLSGKGMLVRGSVSGIAINVDGLYSQGNYNPLVALTNALGGGNAGALAQFKNVTLDTTFLPLVANLGGMSLDVQLDYTSGIGPPFGLAVSGVPTTRVVAGITAAQPGTGQNIGTQLITPATVFDGKFASILFTPVTIEQMQQNTAITLGPAYSLFTQDNLSVAPTCVTNSAGPPFTPAGTWTFKYAYEYANTGVGNASPTSSSCTANGTTQQIAITLPSSPFAAGAIGTLIYASSGGAFALIGNFTPITATSYTFAPTFFNGNAPFSAGSGPAGMAGGLVWAGTVNVSGTTITAPSNTANRTFTLPDTSGMAMVGTGAWVNGHCAVVAVASPLSFADGGCGSGGSSFSSIGSGTNLSAAMLVGTGASLGPTGSGTVSANQINGTLLSGLATGIYKNTTGTGAVTIAVAGDFPTLNQNTTGSAAKWTTARNLAGNSVDGSTDVAFANKFIVQGTVDAGLSGAQFLGALGTGPLKNTTSTGVLSIAASADIYGLWSGSCTSSTFLRGDGACATPSGVSGLTTGFIPKAASATTLTNSAMDDGITTASTITSTEPLTVTGSGGIDFVEQAAPANPAAGKERIYADSTSHNMTCLTSGGGNCFAASGSGISGMTSGQVAIAGSASTITSSKATAGSGAAIVTGPASSTSTDLVSYTGTSGQTQDSGILSTNVVVTNTTNTGGASMTLNMSASTSAASLRVPNIAGASSTTAGVLSYDTTNKMFHGGANTVDNIFGLLPSSISPANNDCVKFTVAASVITLNTAGAACVAGTPTFPITVAGTVNSGGIPYFSSTTVETSSALLAANGLVLGGGAGTAPATVAGLTTDGVSALTLGVAGSSVGAVNFKNATSGTITVSPATGALSSQTLTLPIRTATIATNTGTLTSGNLASFDASGNSIDSTIVASTVTKTIASGTSALGTGAISSGTCATVVTTSATGTATTDTIIYTPNVDPTGVTGYGPSATGSLYIWAYPTANNINLKVCNNTAGSITPGALTLNWRVVR